MTTNVAFEATHLDAPAGLRAPGRLHRGPPPREAPDTAADFGDFRGNSPDRKGSNDDKQEQNSGTLKRCLNRFTSIMLSHLGTLVIVILYVVMGGFLFNYLESGNEIASCSTSESQYLAKLYQASDLVYALSQGSNATQAQSSVLDSLKGFASDVYTLGINPDFNCSSYSNGDTLPTWNIVNAAYFCVTIVTTIGYGHITPMTQWGQIVCIVYGILGIPLMLLFLSKIGEPTAVMFRTFYLNICCCKCFIKKLPSESRQGREEQQTSRAAATVEDGNGGKQPPAKVIEVVEEEEEDSDDEDDEVVNIPITVTVLLLGIYVIIGACVFRCWETWTLAEGAYFSFITLSTIGFGDYVPGRFGPFNSTSVIAELLIGCIYSLFGLALLSMCINLIQDEMAAKFSWIGAKLGVTSKRQNAEGEDEEESSEGEEDSSYDEDAETDTEEEMESRHASVKKKQTHGTSGKRQIESSA